MNNIINQLRYLWDSLTKSLSWVVKNWIIIGTVSGMATGVYSVVSPKVDEVTTKYITSILQPEFNNQYHRVAHRQDSLQTIIDNSISGIKESQTDTALIQFIVAESYSTIKKDLPRTFNRMLAREIRELEKDTVWHFNPFTGKNLGFEMFTIDAKGRLIIYDYEPINNR